MRHLFSPAQCVEHFPLLSSKQNIFYLFVFSDSPEDQSSAPITRREEKRESGFYLKPKILQIQGFWRSTGNVWICSFPHWPELDWNGLIATRPQMVQSFIHPWPQGPALCTARNHHPSSQCSWSLEGGWRFPAETSPNSKEALAATPQGCPVQQQWEPQHSHRRGEQLLKVFRKGKQIFFLPSIYLLK